MEINLLLTVDIREQAALVTHGAPDVLVTLALTGACRLGTLDEAHQLKEWLVNSQSAEDKNFDSLKLIENALQSFGV